MSDRYQNATVLKQANVYFDGKCVSHTVLLADGTRKSLGVIFPSTLTFNTGAPERMEILAGRCRVRLAGATTGWNTSPDRPSTCPATAVSTSRRWSGWTTSATSAKRRSGLQ